MSVKLETVATHSKTTSNSLCDFDSDYGDDESLQEAHEKIYT